MPPHLHPVASTPTFYVTRRQPLSPGAILLATLLAAAALAAVLLALQHNRRAHALHDDGSPAHAGASADAPGNDSDDPNQVDTIVLGDAADAPSPARKGNHVSPVHPTIVIRLPRFGPDSGLIPDSPTGRLLFTWLAAFNHTDAPALAAVLPTRAAASTVAAELSLRRQTGGFTLLSAREPQPGLLVFRLQSQPTPQSPVPAEFLGSLQLQPNSAPPTISTFALRQLPSGGTPPTS